MNFNPLEWLNFTDFIGCREKWSTYSFPSQCTVTGMSIFTGLLIHQPPFENPHGDTPESHLFYPHVLRCDGPSSRHFYLVIIFTLVVVLGDTPCTLLRHIRPGNGAGGVSKYTAICLITVRHCAINNLVCCVETEADSMLLKSISLKYAWF